MAKARSYFEKALQLKPDYAGAYSSLGSLSRENRELEKVLSYYRKAINLKPDYFEAYYNFARTINQDLNRAYYSSSHEDIAKIHQLLESPGLGFRDKLLAYFALGEMYDNCGLYDSAFAHYQKGNIFQRSLLEYDIARSADHIRRIMKIFKKGFGDPKAPRHASGITPIFIVGVPRSGKSVAERLITSNKKIFGAGELSDISKFLNRRLPWKLNSAATFPDILNEAGDPSLLEFAHEYEAHLARLAGGGGYEYAVDTMPENYEYLGVIARMFPRAKIIFCRRDPLDNCLGIYFKLFKLGQQDYACDFEEISHYYGQYLRLMDYWKSVLPISICEVQYENLVRAPEATARMLMDYLNLEWNGECEEIFARGLSDKNGTATSQKITRNHPRSIGWSSNYINHLAPLQEYLQKYVTCENKCSDEVI